MVTIVVNTAVTDGTGQTGCPDVMAGLITTDLGGTRVMPLACGIDLAATSGLTTDSAVTLDALPREEITGFPPTNEKTIVPGLTGDLALEVGLTTVDPPLTTDLRGVPSLTSEGTSGRGINKVKG